MFLDIPDPGSVSQWYESPDRTKMSRIHNIEFYREPGFLAFVWLGPYPARKLSLFLGLPMCRQSNLLTGEGKEGMG